MSRLNSSNSKDILQTGKPSRLLQEGGTWTLEIEHLVSVGPHMLRPMIEKVQEPERIVLALEQTSEHGSLRESAIQLLKSGGDAETDRAYVPFRGEWTPDVLLERSELEARSEVQREHELELLRDEVASLKTTVFRLRDESASGSNQLVQQLREDFRSLMRRVEALEEKVASGSFGRASPSPFGSDPPPDEPMDDSQSPSDAESAQLPDAVKLPSSPEEESEPDGEAVEEAGPSLPPKQEIPFRLPTPVAADNCLEMLVGQRINLEPAEKALSSQYDTLYHCPLLTDEDVLIGSLVCDIEAGVWLGGTLLMVPEGSIEEQISSKNPSEDVLEALSEVFNTLSSIFNDIEDNPHIRITKLEKFDPEKYPSLEQPLERIDLKCTGLAGRIAMLRAAPTAP
ncbi:MAG: hypothetical protein AAF355_00205 [Myxococcota bacterium]